jgi:hypothetical protein
LTTPELGYCAVHKTGTSLPQLARLFDDFDERFLNNESIECPVKPRKLYANVTHYLGVEDPHKNPVNMNAAAPGNGFGVHLPNGKYRFTVRAGSKADPNAVFVQWILEVYFRLHEDKF